jgi:hypothetical protein
LLQDQRINPVNRTNFLVTYDLTTNANVLAFYHPAYGPLGFLLPNNDIEKLASTLIDHVGKVNAFESKTPTKFIN